MLLTSRLFFQEDTAYWRESHRRPQVNTFAESWESMWMNETVQKVMRCRQPPGGCWAKITGAAKAADGQSVWKRAQGNLSELNQAGLTGQFSWGGITHRDGLRMYQTVLPNAAQECVVYFSDGSNLLTLRLEMCVPESGERVNRQGLQCFLRVDMWCNVLCWRWSTVFDLIQCKSNDERSSPLPSEDLRGPVGIPFFFPVGHSSSQ